MENITTIFSSVLTGIMFFGLGIYAEKSKKPMHFWNGDIVDPLNIKDVKAYNKAIAKMWKFYGIVFIISSLLGFYNWIVSLIAYILLLCLGIAVLAIHYEKIKKKHMYDPKNYRIKNNK